MDMRSQRTSSDRLQCGFTLIELMIAVLIVGILAAIAYPSYVGSITKSKRRAAEACLSSYATYMERYYTTNLRYVDADGNAIDLPTLDCASADNTGGDYQYGFSGTPTASTYVLQAAPAGAQQSRDSACGTLTLDQTGARDNLGDAALSTCW
ncbi:type IV pilin protein [Solimonas marina]|uniref:Type IV pilin protein n=1 Tax=Solimonas marina TaxID=2714601 RepID=A0A969WBQ0_9GAMM|nr:type IV pilin protein [Solimonas marina]NKF23170.1 type IV pilin protein [Solimonas marina]